MRPDILIIGEISHSTLAEVFPILVEAEDQPKRKEICIRLTSQGGAATSGLALYDALKLCKKNIRIEAFGECSSIAALVLQAADWRVASEHCRFLLHNGQADVGGIVNAQSMVSGGAELQRTDRLFHTILTSNSHLGESAMGDLCRAESYLTAFQALEVGLIDEILRP